MAKFFKYILLLIIIFVFIVTPLDLIYAQEIFRAPVVGEFTITNGPGEGMHTGNSSYAIDIATAGKKVDIYAVGDGIVEVAGTMVKNGEGKVLTVAYGSDLKGLEIVGFGNYIIIRHDNGYKSLYAHLSEINVKKDEPVTKGQIIAKSGNTGLSLGATGMHLHFEIRKDDKSVDLIGILENFNRDNLTKEYWNWRDGKTNTPPINPSGNITGNAIVNNVSDDNLVKNEISTQKSGTEEDISAIDKITNFFKKLGKFLAKVFSYRATSYVRAAEKEGKIVEDECQLVDSEISETVEEINNLIEKNSVQKNKMPLKIVFEAIIGNEQEIFLLDLEKSSLIRLTNCLREGDFGAFASHPEFTIDYSKIVFSSNMEQGIQVYTMNPDGTGLKKLTNTNSGAWSPSISKDGGKIVYISTDYEGYGNLYIMNSDGSEQTMLENENILEPYSNPSFSFDNEKIVFEADVDYNSNDKSGGTTDIFIINSNGTTLRRITNNNNLEEHNPAFSPDDSKIVFDAFVIDNSSNYHHSEEIYIMNSDGTGIKQLTNNDAYDHNPIIILSDGKKILFESDRGGFDGIYIMDIEGNDQTLITSKRLGNYNPTISPYGGKIAFVSNIDGNPELYLLDLDLLTIKRLTNNNCFDGSPIFSPTGSTIFYNSKFEGKGIYSINISNLTIKKIYNNVFFNNIDFSLDNKKVVFEIEDGFDYSEILIIDLSGSNANMITSNDVYDGNPIFSPDSSKIAYISNIDMQAEIYTMDIDGSNKNRITNNESAEYQIQFSNDGSELLILEENGLYILDSSNLGNKKKIFSSEDYFINYATFTPDNSKILLQMDSLKDKSSGIFIINPDGSNLKNLVKDIIIDNFFIISPDCKKMFYVNDKSSVPELYSINMDGTDLKRLTYFEY